MTATAQPAAATARAYTSAPEVKDLNVKDPKIKDIDRTPRPASLEELHAVASRITANISQVLTGKPDVVRIALVTLLAQGHLLVEDVPGVGKTSLAKALAKSIDCTISRVQFTPDLLPSDITGVSVYHRNSGDFEFRHGPVFANIVIADEINRASPKTQSALLECMAERQVTADGHTYPLGAPFMVVATQNPIELEGTYPLPEAQRDRFTARISVGYPDQAAEMTMVNQHLSGEPLDTLGPVSTVDQMLSMITTVRNVYLAEEIRKYAIDLVAASRRTPELRLGASPRATLHLVNAARAQAALSGRNFVVPDDIHAVVVSVLAHRLVLTAESHANRRSSADIIRGLLNRVPVPTIGTSGKRQ